MEPLSLFSRIALWVAPERTAVSRATPDKYFIGTGVQDFS